jgi:hypothetical protein
MNHIERARDGRYAYSVFRAGVADALEQGRTNPIGQRWQSGTREVELHTGKSVLGDGFENSLDGQANEGFGENAGEHH